jgi:RHS repeat-associated protein
MGNSYSFGYDYENRLTSVSGVATAAFTYDGDGNRVKSVVGSTTTLFVGSHYESSGGVITKYYLAGGTRVAIRTGSAFYWLLSDHLGSTSKVATSTGTLHSQQLYKAWGESRYTSGTLPTRYTYTGQYNASDFGLVFYGSRFYDPLLSRWASPDSIIPQGQGTQAWDRYAYVNNSPVNYTDPTGHDLEQIIFNKTGALPKSQQPPSQKISQKTSQPTLPPRGLVIPIPTPQPDCELCIRPWEQPSSWDTDPNNPDYYSFGFYPGVPGIPIGGTLIIIVDRYQQVYFGIGVNIAKSLASPSYSLTGGYVGSASDSIIPDQGNLPNFLSGWAINASGGIVGGGGLTWAPVASSYIEHKAYEFGAILPASIGVSITYNWKIMDLSSSSGR